MENLNKTILSILFLVMIIGTTSHAETAVCVGVEGTQIVELNDPYMTVARVNVRDSIRSMLKQRSSFEYRSGGIRVKNQSWKYTRIPKRAVLKNIFFNDVYLCESSEN